MFLERKTFDREREGGGGGGGGGKERVEERKMDRADLFDKREMAMGKRDGKGGGKERRKERDG